MDEAGLGPSGELSIHGLHGDVAEVGGDVAGAPEAGGVFFEQAKDPVAAAVGEGGVPVVAGDGGDWGVWFAGFEDADGETGDSAAGVGPAVVMAGAVTGSVNRSALSHIRW